MRQLTEKQYELIQDKLEALFNQIMEGVNKIEKDLLFSGTEIKRVNTQLAEKVSAVYAMLQMIEKTKAPTHDGRGPG